MASDPTCAYVACRCTRPYTSENRAGGTRPVDPDAQYCSDRCEQLAKRDSAHGGCECGHPECAPQATADIPPMQ
jgi:hypothetical protein